MNVVFVVPAFLGGAPGTGELIVVFLVILVLFGPKRLPEFARMIGNALTSLRRASQEFRDQIMNIDQEPESENDIWPEAEEERGEDGSSERLDAQNGELDPAVGPEGEVGEDDSRLAG